jgi:hypothetical protein
MIRYFSNTPISSIPSRPLKSKYNFIVVVVSHHPLTSPPFPLSLPPPFPPPSPSLPLPPFQFSSNWHNNRVPDSNDVVYFSTSYYNPYSSNSQSISICGKSTGTVYLQNSAITLTATNCNFYIYTRLQIQSGTFQITSNSRYTSYIYDLYYYGGTFSDNSNHQIYLRYVYTTSTLNIYGKLYNSVSRYKTGSGTVYLHGNAHTNAAGTFYVNDGTLHVKGSIDGVNYRANGGTLVKYGQNLHNTDFRCNSGTVRLAQNCALSGSYYVYSGCQLTIDSGVSLDTNGNTMYLYNNVNGPGYIEATSTTFYLYGTIYMSAGLWGSGTTYVRSSTSTYRNFYYTGVGKTSGTLYIRPTYYVYIRASDANMGRLRFYPTASTGRVYLTGTVTCELEPDDGHYIYVQGTVTILNTLTVASSDKLSITGTLITNGQRMNVYRDLEGSGYWDPSGSTVYFYANSNIYPGFTGSGSATFRSSTSSYRSIYFRKSTSGTGDLTINLYYYIKGYTQVSNLNFQNTKLQTNGNTGYMYFSNAATGRFGCTDGRVYIQNTLTLSGSSNVGTGCDTAVVQDGVHLIATNQDLTIDGAMTSYSNSRLTLGNLKIGRNWQWEGYFEGTGSHDRSVTSSSGSGSYEFRLDGTYTGTASYRMLVNSRATFRFLNAQSSQSMIWTPNGGTAYLPVSSGSPILACDSGILRISTYVTAGNSFTVQSGCNIQIDSGATLDMGSYTLTMIGGFSGTSSNGRLHFATMYLGADVVYPGRIEGTDTRNLYSTSSTTRKLTVTGTPPSGTTSTIYLQQYTTFRTCSTLYDMNVIPSHSTSTIELCGGTSKPQCSNGVIYIMDGSPATYGDVTIGSSCTLRIAGDGRLTMPSSSSLTLLGGLSLDSSSAALGWGNLVMSYNINYSGVMYGTGTRSVSSYNGNSYTFTATSTATGHSGSILINQHITYVSANDPDILSTYITPAGGTVDVNQYISRTKLNCNSGAIIIRNGVNVTGYGNMNIEEACDLTVPANSMLNMKLFDITIKNTDSLIVTADTVMNFGHMVLYNDFEYYFLIGDGTQEPTAGTRLFRGPNSATTVGVNFTGSAEPGTTGFMGASSYSTVLVDPEVDIADAYFLARDADSLLLFAGSQVFGTFGGLQSDTSGTMLVNQDIDTKNLVVSANLQVVDSVVLQVVNATTANARISTGADILIDSGSEFHSLQLSIAGGYMNVSAGSIAEIDTVEMNGGRIDMEGLWVGNTTKTLHGTSLVTAGELHFAGEPCAIDHISVSGSGTSAAEFHIDVPVYSNYDVSGGTLSVNIDYNIGKDDIVVHGTGIVTVTADKTFTVNTLHFEDISSTITGAGTLTVNGTTEWMSGQFSGTGYTVFEDAVIVSSSGQHLINRRTLVSNHNVSVTGDGMDFTNYATWDHVGEGADGANMFLMASASDITSDSNAGNCRLILEDTTALFIQQSCRIGVAIVMMPTTSTIIISDDQSLQLDGGGLLRNIIEIRTNAALMLGGQVSSAQSNLIDSVQLESNGFELQNGQDAIMTSIGEIHCFPDAEMYFQEDVSFTHNGTDIDCTRMYMETTGTCAFDTNVTLELYTQTGTGSMTFNHLNTFTTSEASLGTLTFSDTSDSDFVNFVNTGAIIVVDGVVETDTHNVTFGTVTGSGNITVLSTTHWSGGIWSGTGTTSLFGHATLLTGSQSDYKYLRRQVAVDANVDWLGGRIESQAPGVWRMVSQTAKSFNISEDNSFWTGSTGQLELAGVDQSVNKVQGTGFALLRLHMTSDSSSLHVETGQLQLEALSSSFTLQNVIEVYEDAQIMFLRGQYTVLPSTTLTFGAGTNAAVIPLDVNSGDVIVQPPSFVPAAGIRLYQGTLTFENGAGQHDITYVTCEENTGFYGGTAATLSFDNYLHIGTLEASSGCTVSMDLPDDESVVVDNIELFDANTIMNVECASTIDFGTVIIRDTARLNAVAAASLSSGTCASFLNTSNVQLGSGSSDVTGKLFIDTDREMQVYGSYVQQGGLLDGPGRMWVIATATPVIWSAGQWLSNGECEFDARMEITSSQIKYISGTRQIKTNKRVFITGTGSLQGASALPGPAWVHNGTTADERIETLAGADFTNFGSLTMATNTHLQVTTDGVTTSNWNWNTDEGSFFVIAVGRQVTLTEESEFQGTVTLNGATATLHFETATTTPHVFSPEALNCNGGLISVVDSATVVYDSSLQLDRLSIANQASWTTNGPVAVTPYTDVTTTSQATFNGITALTIVTLTINHANDEVHFRDDANITDTLTLNSGNVYTHSPAYVRVENHIHKSTGHVRLYSSGSNAMAILNSMSFQGGEFRGYTDTGSPTSPHLLLSASMTSCVITGADTKTLTSVTVNMDTDCEWNNGAISSASAATWNALDNREFTVTHSGASWSTPNSYSPGGSTVNFYDESVFTASHSNGAVTISPQVHFFNTTSTLNLASATASELILVGGGELSRTHSVAGSTLSLANLAYTMPAGTDLTKSLGATRVYEVATWTSGSNPSLTVDTPIILSPATNTWSSGLNGVITFNSGGLLNATYLEANNNGQINIYSDSSISYIQSTDTSDIMLRAGTHTIDTFNVRVSGNVDILDNQVSSMHINDLNLYNSGTFHVDDGAAALADALTVDDLYISGSSILYIDSNERVQVVQAFNQVSGTVSSAESTTGGELKLLDTCTGTWTGGTWTKNALTRIEGPFTFAPASTVTIDDRLVETTNVVEVSTVGSIAGTDRALSRWHHIPSDNGRNITFTAGATLSGSGTLIVGGTADASMVVQADAVDIYWDYDVEDGEELHIEDTGVVNLRGVTHRFLTGSSLQIEEGGELNLLSGTTTFSMTHFSSATATIRVSSGTVTWDSPAYIYKVIITGGTFTFTHDLEVKNLEQTGGTLSIPTGLSLSVTDSTVFSGGTWLGADATSVLHLNDTSTVTWDFVSAWHYLDTLTVNAWTDIAWTNGHVYSKNGATLNIMPGTTTTLSAAVNWRENGGTSPAVNIYPSAAFEYSGTSSTATLEGTWNFMDATTSTLNCSGTQTAYFDTTTTVTFARVESVSTCTIRMADGAFTVRANADFTQALGYFTLNSVSSTEASLTVHTPITTSPASGNSWHVQRGTATFVGSFTATVPELYVETTTYARVDFECADVAAGNVYVANSGKIYVQTTSSDTSSWDYISLSSTGYFYVSSSTTTVFDVNSLLVSSSSLFRVIDMASSASVNVTSVLTLTSTGTLTIDTGNRLMVLSGATFTQNSASSTLNGAGELYVEEGGSATFSAGYWNGGGTCVFDGTLTIVPSSTSATYLQDRSVTTNAAVSFTNSNYLYGTSQTSWLHTGAVESAFVVSGGGDIRTDGVFTLASGAHFNVTGTSTAMWHGWTFTTNVNSLLTVVSGAYLQTQSSSVTLNGDVDLFGTLTVASGNLYSYIGTHTDSGKLVVSGSSTNLYWYTGQTINHLQVTSSGHARILTLDTDINYLAQDSGNLNVAVIATITGTTSWTGGYWIGAGSIVLSGGTTISGASSKYLQIAHVNASSDTSWTNGHIYGSNSAVWTNTAPASNGPVTFTIDTTYDWAGGQAASTIVFEDDAVLNHIETGSTTTIDATVDFQSETSRLHFADGDLRLRGGGNIKDMSSVSGAILKFEAGTFYVAAYSNCSENNAGAVYIDESGSTTVHVYVDTPIELGTGYWYVTEGYLHITGSDHAKINRVYVNGASGYVSFESNSHSTSYLSVSSGYAYLTSDIHDFGTVATSGSGRVEMNSGSSYDINLLDMTGSSRVDVNGISAAAVMVNYLTVQSSAILDIDSSKTIQINMRYQQAGGTIQGLGTLRLDESAPSNQDSYINAGTWAGSGSHELNSDFNMRGHFVIAGRTITSTAPILWSSGEIQCTTTASTWSHVPTSNAIDFVVTVPDNTQWYGNGGTCPLTISRGTMQISLSSSHDVFMKQTLDIGTNATLSVNSGDIYAYSTFTIDGDLHIDGRILVQSTTVNVNEGTSVTGGGDFYCASTSGYINLYRSIDMSTSTARFYMNQGHLRVYRDVTLSMLGVYLYNSADAQFASSNINATLVHTQTSGFAQVTAGSTLTLDSMYLHASGSGGFDIDGTLDLLDSGLQYAGIIKGTGSLTTAPSSTFTWYAGNWNEAGTSTFEGVLTITSVSSTIVEREVHTRDIETKNDVEFINARLRSSGSSGTATWTHSAGTFSVRCTSNHLYWYVDTNDYHSLYVTGTAKLVRKTDSSTAYHFYFHPLLIVEANATLELERGHMYAYRQVDIHGIMTLSPVNNPYFYFAGPSSMIYDHPTPITGSGRIYTVSSTSCTLDRDVQQSVSASLYLYLNSGSSTLNIVPGHTINAWLYLSTGDVTFQSSTGWTQLDRMSIIATSTSYVATISHNVNVTSERSGTGFEKKGASRVVVSAGKRLLLNGASSWSVSSSHCGTIEPTGDVELVTGTFTISSATSTSYMATITGTGVFKSYAGTSMDISGYFAVSNGCNIQTAGSVDFKDSSYLVSTASNTGFTWTHSGDGDDAMFVRDSISTSSVTTADKFVISGTLRRTTSDTTTVRWFFNVELTETGLIWLEAGRLDLERGGTFNGQILVMPGQLRLASGYTYNLLSGSSVEGTGTMAAEAGTINVYGNVNVSTWISTSSASVNFANVSQTYFIDALSLDGSSSDITISGTVDCDSYTGYSNTAGQGLTVSSGGTLISRSTVTLYNNGRTSVYGTMVSEGNMYWRAPSDLGGNGLLQSTGHLYVNGGSQTYRNVYDSLSLETGDVTWSYGYLDTRFVTEFNWTVASGATFTASPSSGTVYWIDSGNSQLILNGAFTKTGSSTADIDVPIIWHPPAAVSSSDDIADTTAFELMNDPSGDSTLTVLTGTAVLCPAGSDTFSMENILIESGASISVCAGKTLELRGDVVIRGSLSASSADIVLNTDSVTVESGASVTGSSIILNSGTLDLSGTMTSPTVQFSSPETNAVTISGSLVSSSLISITTGSINATGSISAANVAMTTTGTATIGGTMSLSGTFEYDQGTLDVTATGSLSGSGTLNADSTNGLSLPLGSSISLGTFNMNTGSLNVTGSLSASTIVLDTATGSSNIAIGGSMTASSTMTVTDGALHVAGDLDARVLTVESVDGFSMSSTGTLDSAHTVNFNNGTVSLDGTISTQTVHINTPDIVTVEAGSTMTATAINFNSGSGNWLIYGDVTTDTLVHSSESLIHVMPGGSLTVGTITTNGPGGIQTESDSIIEFSVADMLDYDSLFQVKGKIGVKSTITLSGIGLLDLRGTPTDTSYGSINLIEQARLMVGPRADLDTYGITVNTVNGDNFIQRRLDNCANHTSEAPVPTYVVYIDAQDFVMDIAFQQDRGAEPMTGFSNVAVSFGGTGFCDFNTSGLDFFAEVAGNWTLYNVTDQECLEHWRLRIPASVALGQCGYLQDRERSDYEGKSFTHFVNVVEIHTEQHREDLARNAWTASRYTELSSTVRIANNVTAVAENLQVYGTSLTLSLLGGLTINPITVSSGVYVYEVTGQLATDVQWPYRLEQTSGSISPELVSPAGNDIVLYPDWYCEDGLADNNCVQVWTYAFNISEDAACSSIPKLSGEWVAASFLVNCSESYEGECAPQYDATPGFNFTMSSPNFCPDEEFVEIQAQVDVYAYDTGNSGDKPPADDFVTQPSNDIASIDEYVTENLFVFESDAFFEVSMTVGRSAATPQETYIEEIRTVPTDTNYNAAIIYKDFDGDGIASINTTGVTVRNSGFGTGDYDKSHSRFVITWSDLTYSGFADTDRLLGLSIEIDIVMKFQEASLSGGNEGVYRSTQQLYASRRADDSGFDLLDRRDDRINTAAVANVQVIMPGGDSDGSSVNGSGDSSATGTVVVVGGVAAVAMIALAAYFVHKKNSSKNGNSKDGQLQLPCSTPGESDGMVIIDHSSSVPDSLNRVVNLEGVEMMHFDDAPIDSDVGVIGQGDVALMPLHGIEASSAVIAPSSSSSNLTLFDVMDQYQHQELV